MLSNREQLPELAAKCNYQKAIPGRSPGITLLSKHSLKSEKGILGIFIDNNVLFFDKVLNSIFSKAFKAGIAI
jgi:hypothetical protein